MRLPAEASGGRPRTLAADAGRRQGGRSDGNDWHHFALR